MPLPALAFWIAGCDWEAPESPEWAQGLLGDCTTGSDGGSHSPRFLISEMGKCSCLRSRMDRLP